MRHLAVASFVLMCTGTAFAQPASPPSAPPAAIATAAPASAAPVPSAAAEAASDLARARIEQIVGGGKSDASWFAPVLLSAVSPAQIDAIVAQLKTALGAYRGAERKSPGVYVVRFERGTDEVDIHFDAQGKIDGLFFRPPAGNQSLDDGLASLAATPHVSYVLLEGRAQRAAVDADRPLAVGSAFKLAVLAALVDQIAARKHRWSDVIRLDPARRSLPTGVLQSWPSDAPVTLATLATEMISISDNTAADTLRALVAGPDLDRYASRNRPFLSTRAAFVMKADSGADLLQRWRAAPANAARTAIAREAERRPLPALAEYPAGPRALDVEWLYSVRELCGMMAHVADVPLMSVNAGVANRAAFRHIAFKGGSEPGVLNLTTRVVTTRGTTYCLSATVNDAAAPIADTAFEATYGAVLNALADR